MGCKICGEEDCKKHGFLFGVKKDLSKKEFAGSSPPEIFIGRWNYPNVYTGILSPEEYGNNEIMASPEMWHSNKLGIGDIMDLRRRLIYGRTQGNVKRLNGKFNEVMKEVAMTHKSVATEFKLKKAIAKEKHPDVRVPLIARAAVVDKVRLQENAKVLGKVDYIVNDTDVKSKDSILELHKSGIDNSNIIKLLSAGLLGLGSNRKLVPTRWAITAVDSNISENMLKKIKDCKQINEYMVFSDEYVGNHYEILLIPRFWSFEVIEISLKSGGSWQDYESFFKRKKYADSVTGAYYSNRVGVVEYLEKIKRQASVLIFREVKPSYYAPLGVGILRETTRSAFKKEPRKFNSLQEAFDDIQTRLSIPIERFLEKSQMMDDMQQKTLTGFMQ